MSRLPPADQNPFLKDLKGEIGDITLDDLNEKMDEIIELLRDVLERLEQERVARFG